MENSSGVGIPDFHANHWARQSTHKSPGSVADNGTLKYSISPSQTSAVIKSSYEQFSTGKPTSSACRDLILEKFRPGNWEPSLWD